MFQLCTTFGTCIGLLQEIHAETVAKFKVHLAPKHFFYSIKQIFAPARNALRFFKLNLDFFIGCTVKVTKCSHHLSHDRASKGLGCIAGLMSPTDLHRSKSLQTYMQRSL